MIDDSRVLVRLVVTVNAKSAELQKKWKNTIMFMYWRILHSTESMKHIEISLTKKGHRDNCKKKFVLP